MRARKRAAGHGNDRVQVQGRLPPGAAGDVKDHVVLLVTDEGKEGVAGEAPLRQVFHRPVQVSLESQGEPPSFSRRLRVREGSRRRRGRRGRRRGGEGRPETKERRTARGPGRRWVPQCVSSGWAGAGEGGRGDDASGDPAGLHQEQQDGLSAPPRHSHVLPRLSHPRASFVRRPHAPADARTTALDGSDASAHALQCPQAARARVPEAED